MPESLTAAGGPSWGLTCTIFFHLYIYLLAQTRACKIATLEIVRLASVAEIQCNCPNYYRNVRCVCVAACVLNLRMLYSVPMKAAAMVMM